MSFKKLLVITAILAVSVTVGCADTPKTPVGGDTYITNEGDVYEGDTTNNYYGDEDDSAATPQQEEEPYSAINFSLHRPLETEAIWQAAPGTVTEFEVFSVTRLGPGDSIVHKVELLVSVREEADDQFAPFEFATPENDLVASDYIRNCRLASLYGSEASAPVTADDATGIVEFHAPFTIDNGEDVNGLSIVHFRVECTIEHTAPENTAVALWLLEVPETSGDELSEPPEVAKNNGYLYSDDSGQTVHAPASFAVVTSLAEDQDEDGVFAPEDCNDQDASIFPGAPDQCADDVDQDCNGQDAECTVEVYAITQPQAEELTVGAQYARFSSSWLVAANQDITLELAEIRVVTDSDGEFAVTVEDDFDPSEHIAWCRAVSSRPLEDTESFTDPNILSETGSYLAVINEAVDEHIDELILSMECTFNIIATVDNTPDIYGLELTAIQAATELGGVIPQEQIGFYGDTTVEPGHAGAIRIRNVGSIDCMAGGVITTPQVAFEDTTYGVFEFSCQTEAEDFTVAQVTVEDSENGAALQYVEVYQESNWGNPGISYVDVVWQGEARFAGMQIDSRYPWHIAVHTSSLALGETEAWARLRVAADSIGGFGNVSMAFAGDEGTSMFALGSEFSVTAE